MSASGLWIQTAQDGWLRAEDIVHVHHTSSLGEPAEREVRVSVGVGGQDAKLAAYVVAYCRSDQEARAIAFRVVQCLATQAQVAGVLRVRQHRVEVTPFGELDLGELLQ